MNNEKETAGLKSLQASRIAAQKDKRRAYDELGAATDRQNAAIAAVEKLGGKVTFWELNGKQVPNRQETQRAVRENRSQSIALRDTDPAEAQIRCDLYNAYLQLAHEIESVIAARKQLNSLKEIYRASDDRFKKAKS